MRLLLIAGAITVGACQPSSAPSNDQAAAAALPTDDERAPLGALVDPASRGSAAEVAHRYAEAIAAGRLGEGYGLLAAGSEAAGHGAAEFAAHFKGRGQLRMTIGKASDRVDGGPLSLVEVPAVLTGIGPDGRPFRREGPLLLRLADRSSTRDTRPRWEIVRTLLPA